ncbi:MAG: tetratricopeptide repeat protein [Polyangiaceae bacterium]
MKEFHAHGSVLPKGQPVHLGKKLITAVMLASVTASTTPRIALAQPPAKEEVDAKTPLALAAEAWESANLPEAAKLYQKALDAGDLYPADVIMSYARMGTALAAQNKNNDALSAFRTAAILDPGFKLPPEAGAKAKKIYDQASKEAQARGGKLTLTAQTPDSVEAKQGFKVTAVMPEEFAVLVDKVRIEVKDPMTKAVVHKEALPATANVVFAVPGKAALPGISLMVRIDALDAHANRWVSQEVRVKVAADPNADKVAPLVPEEDEKPKPKQKGFFQKPWPYVIGGVVIAAGVTIFLATRSPDQVNAGAPSWR